MSEKLEAEKKSLSLLLKLKFYAGTDWFLSQRELKRCFPNFVRSSRIASVLPLLKGKKQTEAGKQEKEANRVGTSAAFCV